MRISQKEVDIMLCAAYIVPYSPLLLPMIHDEVQDQLQKTLSGYHQAAKEISEYHPDTIVIISTKAFGYKDYIHIAPGDAASGSFAKYEHSEYALAVEYDTVLVNQICSLAKHNHIPAGKRGEHSPELDTGTMVPLFFINQYMSSYRVVRISTSEVDFEQLDRLGQCISAAAEDIDRKIVIIVSGELSKRLSEESPYGYHKDAAVFDQFILCSLKDNDPKAWDNINPDLVKASGQTILGALQMLKGAVSDTLFRTTPISYEAPFGIGWLVASFHNKDLNIYRDLARSAMLHYWKYGKGMTKIDASDQGLKRRGGVIVSLYLYGDLYAYAGTIHPTYPTIAQEIVHNAQIAGFHNSQKPPLTKEQLMRCEIKIHILSEYEPIFFIEDLNVKYDGLIVTSNQKQGLVFPSTAGIQTPAQQLALALKKGNIDADEYFTMERFQLEHC